MSVEPVVKAIRLDVTEQEQKTIRLAVAIAGYRSMAEMARSTLLERTEQIIAKAGLQSNNILHEKVMS